MGLPENTGEEAGPGEGKAGGPLRSTSSPSHRWLENETGAGSCVGRSGPTTRGEGGPFIPYWE